MARATDRLFHLISRAEWDTARVGDQLEPASLGTEGFVHLSSAEQVTATANRFYPGRDDLVALVVDPTRVDGELRWEDTHGHGALFPHLYGPLPTGAVHHIIPVEVAADATLHLDFDHTGGDVEALAADYPAARERFLAAAAVGGATVEAHPHPLRGPGGGDLFADTASVGDPDSSRVLVVVSATHGVEGYCGSALQAHWLAHHRAEVPDRVRVVFVHGLNPYGFAWVRRVNEDNVDLNRNFIDWDTGTVPVNDDYGELADLLVPERWSPADQRRTTDELVAVATRWGYERTQAVISTGQYRWPTGIFYGGPGPTWSNRWLRSWAAVDLADATEVAVLDLHTGLGPWGDCQLIGSLPADHPDHRRAVQWWGDVVPMGADRSVSARLSGDWLGTVDRLAPGARTTAVALEYGTVDQLQVLQALRADAWLHAHGDPRSADGDAIRAQVRAAFADDDPAWVRSCWPHFLRATRRALAHLAA